MTRPDPSEVLADASGLTSVRGNRRGQQARRRGELVWSGRNMRLRDVERSHREHHAVRSPDGRCVLVGRSHRELAR